MLRTSTILLLLTLLVSHVAAGQIVPDRELEVGLSITANGYYGDLNHDANGLLSTDFLSFYPGVNLHVRKAQFQRLVPRLNLGYGKFLSQNPDIQPVTLLNGDPPLPTLVTPNKFVETTFLYLDFGYRIQLVRKLAKLNPYLGFGLGGMAFYPHAEDGILLSRKRSTRAPDERAYGTMTLSAPLTAGLDVNLSRKISLNLAYVYRVNSTDYLDNIKTLGTHAGNDQLHVFRFGASFRFRNKPPRPDRPRPEPVPMDSLIAAAPIAEDTSISAVVVEDQIGELPSADIDQLTSKPNCDSLIADYREQIAEHRLEIDALEREIRELNLLVLNTARERDELRLALESAENQAGKADNAILMSQLRAENDQIQGELDEATQQLKAKDRQIRLLDQQIITLQDAIKSLDTQQPVADDSRLSQARLRQEEAEARAEEAIREQRRLIQENARLSMLRDSLRRELETLEENQSQFATILGERTEQIQDLEEKLEKAEQRCQENEADLQAQIATLREALEANENPAPTLDPSIVAKLQELSAKDDEVNRQLAQLRATELQLEQQEAKLQEARTELAAQEKKYVDLTEKEKYLKQLEQQLKQYASSLREQNSSGQEKIAAFSIPCDLEKKIVQQRIVTHFADQGYTYLLEKGKLVYLGVILPEISQRPMNISMYLIRDGKYERQLLGSFRLQNGDYLSDAQYPEESRKAKRFLRQFAK